MARALAYAIGLVGLVSVANQSAGQEPQTNDLFDSQGVQEARSFRGWNVFDQGLGVRHQPFAVFERDGIYLVARTLPERRSPRGGIEIERILELRRASPEGDETALIGGDCSFLGFRPAITFFSPSTKIARGYFVMEEEIEMRRWLVDDPSTCAFYWDVE